MEKITDGTSLATLDHETSGTKLHALVNNGLSDSIKKVNYAIVKKHRDFNL